MDHGDRVALSPGRTGAQPVGWRLVLSKGLSLLYRLFHHHKLYTYTSCFRVYRRSSVKEILVRNERFVGIMEILSRVDAQGGHIVECPAVMEVRLLGNSKMKILKTIWGHLVWMGQNGFWSQIGATKLRSQRRNFVTQPAMLEEAVITLPSDQEASGRSFGREEIDELVKVIESGTLTCTKGTACATLEKRFADLLGAKYAIACASGSAAVHCAVAAIDPEPGDEIITTPITDMGALTPILYQGAIPVFADVDPLTGNVTAETIARCLSPRTKAIIVTHLFGNPCEMGPIVDLARKHGLPVMEDCAQAYLARDGGKLVGTHGAIGCFSLQQGKHITTGEGGLCVTNDPDLARRIRLFVNKAWGYGDPNPDHYFLALNYRLTELQGAVRARAARQAAVGRRAAPPHGGAADPATARARRHQDAAPTRRMRSTSTGGTACGLTRTRCLAARRLWAPA